MKLKGVISENLVNAFGIVISVTLIFLLANALFGGQTEQAAVVSYSNVAEDVASVIDRVAAEAGSAVIEYKVPAGLKPNITISYKSVDVQAGGLRSSKPFSALTHADIVSINDPDKLCIVKTRNDRRINVREGACSCNLDDEICSPECIIQSTCDPACITEEKDNICMPGCMKPGDGICDLDCYTNDPDGVWDPDCSSKGLDGICDPDSAKKDGYCDPDCLLKYNNTVGFCDLDCIPDDLNKDKLEDRKDGICYAGCGNKRAGGKATDISGDIRLEAADEDGKKKDSGILFSMAAERAADYGLRLQSQTQYPKTCDRNNESYGQCIGAELYVCGNYIGTCALRDCFQATQYPNPNLPVTDLVHKFCRPPGGGGAPDADAKVNYNMGTIDSCCCKDGKCEIGNRGQCIIRGGYAYANDSVNCQEAVEPPATLAWPKECDGNNQSFLQCAGRDIYLCGQYGGIRGTGTCGTGYCVQPAPYPYPNNTFTVNCGPITVANAPENYNRTDIVACCCKNGACSIENRGTCIRGADEGGKGGFAYPADNENCKEVAETPGGGKRADIFLPKDGVCDLDCAAGSTVCDLDCPDALNGRKCRDYAIENEPCGDSIKCRSDLACSPTNKTCVKNSCGNGICETRDMWKKTDNPRYWENPYTCPQDCPGTADNRKTCDDIGAGAYTGAPCYDAEILSYQTNKIEVCNANVEAFLDRRNWDIKEVAETTLKEGPPWGFAFDWSRYEAACQRMATAGQVLSANENYTLTENCCDSAYAGACDMGAKITPLCKNVGFCSDHTTGLLSALRRLGVPPTHVWGTFLFTPTVAGGVCGAHAGVAYKCDQNLPENLKLKECEGRWGDWLFLDSTRHFIAPILEMSCSDLCTWWNDKDLYAKADAGGKINATHGFAYPPGLRCKSDMWKGQGVCQSGTQAQLSCQFDKVCKDHNITCIRPNDASFKCPDETETVCGLDGMTYKNRCEALRKGAVVVKEGAC
ncbi:MAG: hypothetical protein HYX24_00690 [Candidatus Aenigmarchaeota archaeon]|nr:hypothetical protein [Candidatus Aenigmarchaeota archaeon]